MECGALILTDMAIDWNDLAALQRALRSPEGQATAQDLADHLARLSPEVRSMIYEVEDV